MGSIPPGGLSVAAALTFSVSTTLKNRSAVKSQPRCRRRSARRPIGRGSPERQLRHPLWLAGLAADGIGLACQVIALHLGALAVVQPLMVTGLLFALLLRHQPALARQPAGELLWGAATRGLPHRVPEPVRIGLGRPASRSAADRLPAVIATAAGVLTALACLGSGSPPSAAATRAALIGVAVGAITPRPPPS